MKIIIERYGPGNILHVPYRYPDGKFRMAADLHGKTKHYAANAVSVDDEKCIVIKLLEGFHLRMAPLGQTDADMIAPQNIAVRFEKEL